ncbi:MAG: agmatinase [Spirochaetales bacterium]|nr:agmatinase [Spirochaetales bacterium]
MEAVFLDIDKKYTQKENAAYTIIPVPYDETSTWKKGAHRGPDAVIEASAQIEWYDIETGTEPYTRGIHTLKKVFDFSSPDAMVDGVRAAVAEAFRGKSIPIVLGGEHSVSIGAIYAAAEAYPECTILQLDAHTDLRDEYHGSRFNHACVMRRAVEKCPIVQVGIRSGEADHFEPAYRSRMFCAEKITGSTAWIENVLPLLSQHVYITIDLDVFDPSIMPSTGTPEPGGLLWYPVLNLLRRVIDAKTCIGFDVVELCPNGQPHAEFLAAKLVYKLIACHAAKTAPDMRFA